MINEKLKLSTYRVPVLAASVSCSLEEAAEVCLCVAVECRWMHMDRERGEGESTRDLGKRRRHGLGG